MFPTSVISLVIIVTAVLPGSMYTWAFERQVSAYGVTFADRALRFIALSVIFHAILGWGEYGLFRAAFFDGRFQGGQFAAAWGALLGLVVIPGMAGGVLGGIYATRSAKDEWIRRCLSPAWEDRLLRFFLGRAPAPRAWDNLFSERPTAYLRIETTDGTAVAGLFATSRTREGSHMIRISISRRLRPPEVGTS